jgi:choline transporter-like protein 2/4/5
MGDDQPTEEKPKNYKNKAIDDHRKRYAKKDEADMTDDEKKENEAMMALNNGPTDDEFRSCQDILCCLLFVAFVVGCVVITAIGFKEGDPMKLTFIYDDDGVPCGKKGGKAESYPYLYLYDAMSDVSQLNISTDILSKGYCVKACPTSYNVKVLDCLPTSLKQNCVVNKVNIYLSELWLEKLCVPSKDLYDKAKEDLVQGVQGIDLFNNSDLAKNVTVSSLTSDYAAMGGLINTNFISGDKLFDYLGDCQTVWPIFLACIGIALVIGFFYLLIIRLCGGCIAYIVILLILALFIGLGIFFYIRRDIYIEQGDKTYENIMLGFAIFFWVLGFIWLMIIICSCNKIRLAIAITEVSARFVWDVCSILFTPVIIFFIVAVYLAYWITLAVYIYSAGEAKKSETTFLTTIEW